MIDLYFCSISIRSGTKMSWFSKLFGSKDKEKEDDTKIPMTIDEERMTPEEEKAFIDKTAQKIVNYYMDFPASLFLEAFKPFASVGGDLFYFITPFLNAF